MRFSGVSILERCLSKRCPSKKGKSGVYVKDMSVEEKWSSSALPKTEA